MMFLFPPSCPSAQLVLPISHQPVQNKAERGTAKFKFNTTHKHCGIPVQHVLKVKSDDEGDSFEGTGCILYSIA